ncbi:MAG: hypothetical protein ACKVP7_09830 [Hyphomicrobiaceae bacterium]
METTTSNMHPTNQNATPNHPAPALSKAAQLVNLAIKHADLFHDGDGVAYAKVKVKGRSEVYAVDSTEFRQWLDGLGFAHTQTGFSQSTLNAAVATLCSRARHVGPKRTVHLRTAIQDGVYYIDLCDAKRRVVEVGPYEWRILDRAPVLFRRTSHMRALPLPRRNGTFDAVKSVVNLPKLSDQILVLAWLIESLRPNTPYVGLGLFGEAGTTKSSTQHFLCSLVDPGAENLRTKPESRKDLFVEAHNSRLVSYENLSKLTPDIQDALCSMLTGGGFSTRRLRTNTALTTFSIKRPVILNGVENVVTAPDLADRFICLDLELVGERRTEVEVKAQQRRARGEIFGAILTSFSKALAIMPKVAQEKLDLPRMSDFAVLGEAISRSYGMAPGWFISVFNANRKVAVRDGVAAEPFCDALASLALDRPGGFVGTFAELRGTLESHVRRADVVIPRSGQARRLAPALRQLGISLAKLGQRSSRETIWQLKAVDPAR